MIERDRTRKEVLLDPQESAFKSLDEILALCLPRLTTRLWSTCSWPAPSDEDWKIGDFNFLILSVEPEANVRLYVQFWSEPQERVRAEVSSGERSPEIRKYLPESQPAILAELGYALGGGVDNFQKTIDIASCVQAETLAREALTVLHQVFGYRGQWELSVECHQGQRAVTSAVYTSITAEDFVKLALSAAFDARSIRDADRDFDPIVLIDSGKRRAIAVMEGREPGTDLFNLVTLKTIIASSVVVTDASLLEVNRAMRFLHVYRVQSDLVAELPVSLVGGVTADWLIESLGCWLVSCRKCESLLKTRLQRPAPRELAVTRIH